MTDPTFKGRRIDGDLIGGGIAAFVERAKARRAERAEQAAFDAEQERTDQERKRAAFDAFRNKSREGTVQIDNED